MIQLIVCILILIFLAIISPRLVRKLLAAFALLVAILFTLVVVFALVHTNPDPKGAQVSKNETLPPKGESTSAVSNETAQNIGNANLVTNEDALVQMGITTRWKYDKADDMMSKTPVYQAQISSANFVNFSFPYEGDQRATLIVRVHPRFGKDVILKLEKGQFLCQLYNGCSVLVRFDQDSAAKFQAAASADNSADTIFIHNFDSFVERLLTAKRLRIAATIYKEGEPTFDFDVHGFDRTQLRYGKKNSHPQKERR